jgi:sedoheptulokinase
LEPVEERVYERLNELAENRGGAGELRVRTTFLGVRGHPAVQAGAVEGIPLEGLTLGALARATLVGIVDELHNHYRAHAGDAAGHTRLVATGGGVRKIPLLPGVIGERFRLPVQVPQWQETAALGAAALAAGQL